MSIRFDSPFDISICHSISGPTTAELAALDSRGGHLYKDAGIADLVHRFVASSAVAGLPSLRFGAAFSWPSNVSLRVSRGKIQKSRATGGLSDRFDLRPE